MSAERRTPFTCRKCHTQLGEIINKDNAFLLKIGQAVATNFAGTCAICGQSIYWNVNVQALQAVLQDLGIDVSVDELEK